MKLKRRRRATRRCAGIARAVGVLAVAGLGIAVPAQAASCTLVSGTVVAHMPGATDVVGLHRVGDAIYNGPLPCGAATVSNTDLVIVNDTSPNGDGTNMVNVDLGGGPLAPGLTSEGPGGVSEIEVILILRRGTNTVWVTGSDGPDDIHAGVRYGGSGLVRGINLNAAAEQGKVADADMTYQEAPLPNIAAEEPLILDGGAGDDTLDASGGAAFDTSVIQPVTLIGATGDDVLAGRGGNDTLDGGWGSDTASYRLAAAGVRVDLGTLGPQNTGGAGADTLSAIENLAGSPFADVLTGDGKANTLTGWEGEDSLSAEGGDDHVAVRDGARDLVTCGTGADAVDADEQGVDSIFGDCETSAFAPVLPPQGDAWAPPAAGPAATVPADTVAPALDQLTLEPRRFRTARSGAGAARVTGTTVLYRLSEPASAHLRVQRARAGRRVGGRCVRPTSANRRARRCRQWRRVRGTLLQSGLAGLNRLAFDGAGRRTAAASRALPPARRRDRRGGEPV